MNGTHPFGDVRRGFDDNLAAALFKFALIERYCWEQISALEVERIFADGPAVEHLIHHQKSHAIAQIEKFRRRRIVGGSYRIDPK